LSALINASRKPGFCSAFALALALGVAAAVVLAPLVADGLAAVGLRIPFPRIFDRVVMVALAVALLLYARRLGLAVLLRDGFGEPRRSLPRVLVGMAIAIAVMVILFALAIRIAHQPLQLAGLILSAIRYSAAAILIGVIEEAFFRVVLLGGIARDFDWRVALPASAAIYALAHLIRSPKHYYLMGFHPAAGFANLASSLERIVHPDGLAAMTFGLFLLGLLFGTAFIRTDKAYLSIGLHAGFVMGAKCWPLVAAGSSQFPRWLAGPGPVPLIAAPAAWAFALALTALIALATSHEANSGKR
jgi:membrane protease YdiL (CAAX protease family)